MFNLISSSLPLPPVTSLLSIAFFASESEASFLPRLASPPFNLVINAVFSVLTTITLPFTSSEIPAIFSKDSNLVPTANINCNVPASNDPFLFASVSKPSSSFLIFFPIALASSSIDLTRVSTSLTLSAKALASFIFLLIFAKSSTVPSDLATSSLLSSGPPLLHDVNTINKVIIIALILFLIFLRAPFTSL
ncbi:hypothetical protein AXX13_N24 (plasmid) [Borrelia hermsii HS1]|uniref:Variable outer membrane protein n=1 Tax=Borrelia hermsii HS1 TaxID=1867252 RepID=A0ABM6ARP8_BORHE|nr:hypothetical protein AXX13_N24 [Borrelia hermsii HS1]